MWLDCQWADRWWRERNGEREFRAGGRPDTSRLSADSAGSLPGPDPKTDFNWINARSVVEPATICRLEAFTAILGVSQFEKFFFAVAIICYLQWVTIKWSIISSLYCSHWRGLLILPRFLTMHTCYGSVQSWDFIYIFAWWDESLRVEVILKHYDLKTPTSWKCVFFPLAVCGTSHVWHAVAQV